MLASCAQQFLSFKLIWPRETIAKAYFYKNQKRYKYNHQIAVNRYYFYYLHLNQDQR